MKKYIYLSLAIVTLLQSCSLTDFNPETWAPEPNLTLSNSMISAGARSCNFNINVYTNYNEIKAVTSDPSWCTANVIEADSNGVKTFKVNIALTNNMEAKQRSATVDVTVSHGGQSLTRQIALFQVGGEYEIINNLPVYFNQKLSDSQKEIITGLINELIFVDGDTMSIGNNIQTANPIKLDTLSSFYIGTYELKQDQWEAVMGYNPSRFQGAKKPIENVTFTEITDFLVKLTDLTGLNFTLPTSAQWEFAARGGKKSHGYTYAGSNDPNEVGHFIDSNTPESSPTYTTKDVGSMNYPNELGLFDMSGNVFEICSDYWSDNASMTDTKDPTGPTTGTWRIMHGGSFINCINVSYIYKFYYEIKSTNKSFCGFRVSLNQ